MKVGIMQPYFFPYIGYWQLMNYVDKYVIYDDVNYIKGGWINRNRILLNNQPHYFNIILKGASSFKKINEIEVDGREIFIKKNLKILESAYKKAPYYSAAMPVIEDILQCGKDTLIEYLLYLHLKIAEYLEMETEVVLSSMLEKDETLTAENKVIDICKKIGGNEYINASGGQKLYSREHFENEGINLKFLIPNLEQYSQFSDVFVEGLSIIDVMMFNDISEIKNMMCNFELV